MAHGASLFLVVPRNSNSSLYLSAAGVLIVLWPGPPPSTLSPAHIESDRSDSAPTEIELRQTSFLTFRISSVRLVLDRGVIVPTSDWWRLSHPLPLLDSPRGHREAQEVSSALRLGSHPGLYLPSLLNYNSRLSIRRPFGLPSSDVPGPY